MRAVSFRARPAGHDPARRHLHPLDHPQVVSRKCFEQQFEFKLNTTTHVDLYNMFVIVDQYEHLSDKLQLDAGARAACDPSGAVVWRNRLTIC